MNNLIKLRKRIMSQRKFLSILMLISFVGAIVDIDNILWVFPLVMAFFGNNFAIGIITQLDRQIRQAHGYNEEEYF